MERRKEKKYGHLFIQMVSGRQQPMGCAWVLVVVYLVSQNFFMCQKKQDEPPKVFNVRIEHAPSAAKGKVYLGGYRSRRSGLEYHHASAQTNPLPQRQTGPEKFTREAQTQEQETRSIQTKREGGTQMARKDLYIDESGDREIVPRMYFSSQQHADLRLRKCIVVQCYHKKASPVDFNLSETQATLSWGQRARSVELGKAKKNTQRGRATAGVLHV